MRGSEAMQRPSFLENRKNRSCLDREQGRERASCSNCLLHTPSGAARTGAFQAFPIKPPGCCRGIFT